MCISKKFVFVSLNSYLKVFPSFNANVKLAKYSKCKYIVTQSHAWHHKMLGMRGHDDCCNISLYRWVVTKSF